MVMTCFLLAFYHQFPLSTSPRNWQAFDDEGMACLVECCPGLEVLLLDRAEPLGFILALVVLDEGQLSNCPSPQQK